MANAARVHAVERGKIVDDHTLIAFGGAAPLHAARVAEKLGIDARHRAAQCRRRLGGRIPARRRSPTSWCAAATCASTLSMPDASTALLAEMAREAHGAGRRRGARGAPIPSGALAFMRYVGQGHEIAVAAAGTRPLRATTRRRCARRSSATTRRCSRANPGCGDRDPELVGAGLAPRPSCRSAAAARAARGAAPRRAARGAVFDRPSGRSIDVPVYRRERLAAGRASPARP